MEFKLKKLTPCLSVKEIANVHFFVFPENYYTGKDKHFFTEMVYVSSGVLNIRSDSYNGTLKKGEAIFHAPDENHALSCVKGNEPTVIIIGFTHTAAPAALYGKAVALSAYETELLSNVVKEGRNVFAPPYDVPTTDMQKKKNIPFGAEQILKNCIETLCISVIRRGLVKSEKERSPVGGFDVKETIKYVDENFKEKITIDELSFIFGTNRSTLCREFKAATKKSVNEYVVGKKLAEAKRLLTETDNTVTEIAENLNFSCIHYFTAFFKTHTGLSPTEYKSSARKQP